MAKEVGYVYILTNPSFREDWVKIGKTTNMEERLRTLYNTSLPLPFEVFATLKTAKYNEAEKLVHRYIERFTNLRIEKKREFFNVKPEEALEIFKDVSLLLDDAEIDEVYKKDVVDEADLDEQGHLVGDVLGAALGDRVRRLAELVLAEGDLHSARRVLDGRELGEGLSEALGLETLEGLLLDLDEVGKLHRGEDLPETLALTGNLLFSSGSICSCHLTFPP